MQAAAALASLLEEVPAIKVRDEHDVGRPDRSVDIFAKITVSGQRYLIPAKSNRAGSPVMSAWARCSCATTWPTTSRALPIFIAPYLSRGASPLSQREGGLPRPGRQRTAGVRWYHRTAGAQQAGGGPSRVEILSSLKSARILRVLLRALTAGAWPNPAKRRSSGSRPCKQCAAGFGRQRMGKALRQRARSPQARRRARRLARRA